MFIRSILGRMVYSTVRPSVRLFDCVFKCAELKKHYTIFEGILTRAHSSARLNNATYTHILTALLCSPNHVVSSRHRVTYCLLAGWLGHPCPPTHCIHFISVQCWQYHWCGGVIVVWLLATASAACCCCGCGCSQTH